MLYILFFFIENRFSHTIHSDHFPFLYSSQPLPYFLSPRFTPLQFLRKEQTSRRRQPNRTKQDPVTPWGGVGSWLDKATWLEEKNFKRRQKSQRHTKLSHNIFISAYISLEMPSQTHLESVSYVILNLGNLMKDAISEALVQTQADPVLTALVPVSLCKPCWVPVAGPVLPVFWIPLTPTVLFPLFFRVPQSSRGGTW